MNLRIFLLAALMPVLAARQKDEIKIETTYATIDMETGRKKFYGRVRVATKDFTIEADEVQEFPKEYGTRLWCSGNCIVRPNDANYTLFADELEADIDAEYFTAYDAFISATKEYGRLKDRYLRAKKIVRISDQLELYDVTMTTCEFNPPDYGISARLIRTRLHNGVLDLDKTPVQIFDSTIDLFGIPLLYWPYYKMRRGEDFLLDSALLGRTSRYGNYSYLTWGVDAAADNGLGAEFKLETDYRQFRGYSSGLDVEWGYRSSHYGYIDTYFMRDRGPNLSNDFDKKFASLDVEKRYRARTFNRFRFGDFTGDIEFSKFSDRFLLEDMFPKEFKTEKEQESTAFVKYSSSGVYSSLQYKERVNDFQTQLERLPELVLYLDDLSLFDTFNFSNKATFSNLRNRFDDDLGIADRRSWRVHNQNELSYNTSVEFVNASVFAVNNLLYYEEDLEEKEQYRDVLSLGVNLSAAVKKDYGSFIHRMDFGVGSSRVVLENGSTEDLINFSEQELLERYWETNFTVNQIFYMRDSDSAVYRAAEFKLEVEYYPNWDSDTERFAATNFLYPFNWVAIYPLPGETPQSRRFSNVLWALELTPRGRFDAVMSGEYNTHKLQEDIRYVNLSYRPVDEVTVSLTEFKQADTTDTLGAGLKSAIADKWAVGFEIVRDLELDRFVRKRLTFDRDLHDFVLRFLVDRDLNRDENLYLVTLLPKFLKKDIMVPK